MLLESFYFFLSFGDTFIMSVVQYSHVFLVLGNSKLDTAPRCVSKMCKMCLSSAEWWGRITLLDLQAALCLMQLGCHWPCLRHRHTAGSWSTSRPPGPWASSVPSCFAAGPQHDPWKPASTPGLFFLSSSVSHRILTNRSWNRLNTAFPKTRAHILPFALLLLRILSSTILCLQQTFTFPISSSCFVSMTSNRVSPSWIHSTVSSCSSGNAWS